MFEHLLRRIVGTYFETVAWVAQATGFEDRLLHVHAGLLIFVVVKLVTRRSFASPLPLICVYVGAVINEIFDRLNHGRWMPDTGSDVLYTVFWPTILFILIRWFSSGGARRSKGRRR